MNENVCVKRVILTGASGFIGRHVISELLKNKYEVHALYNKTEPIMISGVFYHKIDLLDFIQQKLLISKIKPTHLLHFAWFTTHREYWSSTENLCWVQASLELLKLFYQFGGKRVVFVGSCAEYDWSYGYCSEEITPKNPSMLYGVCKNSLQEMFTHFSRQVGISNAWGRIFFLYGQFEPEQRLIPYVINSLISNTPAKCTHGYQVRDFLYVKDVASAFVALLDSGVEGSVNIASGQPVVLREIIYLIANKMKLTNMLKVGELEVQKNEPMFIVADIKRLRDEVSWTPKFSLEDGINETIEWWKNKHENK